MRASLTLFTIIGFLVGLVYWLPAALVADVAVQNGWISGNASLGRVSGRVWKGEAVGIRVADQPVDTVQWRWRPGGIRRAELTWQIKGAVSGAQADAEISWRPNQVSVRGLVFTVPARLIAEEWVSWPLRMEGTIEGRVETLRYRPGLNRVQAEGIVQWKEAASGYPQPAQLGSLQAEITTEQGGEALLVGLQSDQRFLNLDGEATVGVTGDYSMALSASPGPRAGPRLINALRLLGLKETGGQPVNIQSAGVLAPGGLGFPTID